MENSGSHDFRAFTEYQLHLDSVCIYTERILHNIPIGVKYFYFEMNMCMFKLYYSSNLNEHDIGMHDISVLHSHFYYFKYNISRYDFKLYFEKLYTQENFLYHHNNHLHSTFTKFLNFFYFAYNSNITGNVTVQCSLCAKRLHSQQPC